MDECQHVATYISSYQDTLIIRLHRRPFAIKFRRLALGWRQDVARKPAGAAESINDLGI
jgi:hypothetical protein